MKNDGDSFIYGCRHAKGYDTFKYNNAFAGVKCILWEFFIK